MATNRTIVVAGAGIGGLTAALALAARGYRVVVLEKAERLEQIGAGIQLSPNASRILCHLGLRDSLAARAIAPDAVSLMSARAGGEIARLPLGDAATFRAGAPYWVIHRADLQTVLFDAACATADVDVRLGTQFEDAAPHANGITVSARHGFDRDNITALALIGADGVWSSVRHRTFSQAQPVFSGQIAWRGTFDTRQLPREMAPKRVQVWMGPNAHVVVYPISNGQRVNVVVIVHGDWNRPGWSAPGDANEMRGLMGSGWPALARMTVNAVDAFTRYALFTMPDGGIWNNGPVALLGDASHAMLPFAAQGAGMAIEDAAVLASCVGDFDVTSTPEKVAAGLQRYAGQRSGRVARMQRTARKSGKIFHLKGPMALARDMTIQALGGKQLLARQDWIYDWQA